MKKIRPYVALACTVACLTLAPFVRAESDTHIAVTPEAIAQALNNDRALRQAVAQLLTTNDQNTQTIAGTKISESANTDASVPESYRTAARVRLPKNAGKTLRFEPGADRQSIIISFDDQRVARIKSDLTVGDGFTEPTVVLRNDLAIYFVVDETVYQFDLDANHVSALAHKDATFGAIAPNEMLHTWIAESDDGAEYIALIANDGWTNNITLPVAGARVGEMSFSPDNSQLVFTTTQVKQGVVQGALYSFDLISGQKKLVAETKQSDSVLHLNGWSDNTITYYETQMGEDFLFGEGQVNPEDNEVVVE